MYNFTANYKIVSITWNEMREEMALAAVLYVMTNLDYSLSSVTNVKIVIK